VVVGSYFGKQYPCIGQIFDSVHSSYILLVYTTYLYEDIASISSTMVYAAVHMYSLFNAVSTDYCSRGILF
jgi:hypothetical protein